MLHFLWALLLVRWLGQWFGRSLKYTARSQKVKRKTGIIRDPHNRYNRHNPHNPYNRHDRHNPYNRPGPTTT